MVESYPDPVKEGQQYINLKPGRLFSSHPKGCYHLSFPCLLDWCILFEQANSSHTSSLTLSQQIKHIHAAKIYSRFTVTHTQNCFNSYACTLILVSWPPLRGSE